MLNDRGTIKWTSLMLPEHVQLLKQMWQETKKISQPIIDAQMVEILEGKLIEAYNNKQCITVYYYDGGSIKQVIGKIVSFNLHENKVIFTPDDNQPNESILFEHIVSIH